MSKPILRWTLGNVSKEGIECLEISIKEMIRLYSSEFEYFLCYNNIDIDSLKWIKNYPIQLINQHDFIDELSLSPVDDNPCWKLYPPRLDINRHEMFMDNDLIIYNRIPTIDHFLSNDNLLFITEAFRRSYGAFDSMIESKVNYNTGFFGVFPGFDLKNEINAILNLDVIQKWTNHLDEQGLLSYIFHNNNCELITLDQINVCHHTCAYKAGMYGQHFVGLNRAVTSHWLTYLKLKMTKLIKMI